MPATPQDAATIWNRAVNHGQALTQRGDVALAALLVFHGEAMNGGVLSALDYRIAPEVDAAIRGYMYFGLDDVAAVIETGRVEVAAADDADENDEVLEQLEQRLDALYH